MMESTNGSFVRSGFDAIIPHGFIHLDSEQSKLPATVFALVVVGILSLVHGLLLEPLVYGKLAHVPGPKLAAVSWYYLSFWDMFYRRNDKINEWHKKYGPVFRIRPNDVIVASAKDFREIFDTKTKYDKTLFYKRFTLYGEDNLFSTLKYSDHQIKKRKINAPYSKTNIALNAETIVRERIACFIKEVKLARHGLVDFFVLTDCYAHDVVTRYLYGPTHGTNTISSSEERPLVVAMKRGQLYTPLALNLSWLHGSWSLKVLLGESYRQIIEQNPNIQKAIEQKLAEHDQDPEKDEYYSLYRVMREAHQDGDHLTHNYMASELYDHLKAGQQTTSSALTFAMWRLSKYPKWQRKLQDEVRSAETDADGTISIATAESCPVLNAVIKETLRRHIVASGRSERIVPEGGRMYSDVYIPQGTTVVGHTPGLHFNTNVFPHAWNWKPERWLNATTEESKAMEYNYAPFGHGPRGCIGQHLAMLEMRLLLSVFYRRFTTKLSETTTDEEMHQLATFTAVPRGMRCELYVSEE